MGATKPGAVVWPHRWLAAAGMACPAPVLAATEAPAAALTLSAAGLLLALAAVLGWWGLRLRRQLHTLSESDARYRVFYDHAPVAIMVSDPDHRVLDWNRAAERLFGWTREEVLGLDFFDFLVPAPDVAGQRTVVNQTVHTSMHANTMSHNLRRDGLQLICDWNHSVITDGNGTVTAVVSMAVDMTEQRRMERELRASERRFRSLAENANDVIWTSDLHGQFTYISPAVERAGGFTPGEVMALGGLTDMFQDDERAGIEEDLAALRRDGRLRRNRWELKLWHRSGRPMWVEMTLAVLRDEDGCAQELLGINRDVTEQRHAREEMLARAAAIEASADAVIISGTDSVTEYVNPAFTAITGFTAEEVVGLPAGSFGMDADEARQMNESVQARLAAGEVWEGETRMIHRNGEQRIGASTIAPVFDADGNVIRFVCVMRDVTERKAMEARLEQLAHYDALTGLPNRTLFFERLAERMRLQQRGGGSVALLFVDLDGFKAINDRYGHACGDEVLAVVARRFRTAVRESDTVARMGGDEFAVLLGPTTLPEEAAHVGEKLMQSLEAPVSVRGTACGLGASVGVALYPDHATEADGLLRCADQAMYAAKQAGRNRLSFYGEAVPPGASRLMH